MIPFLCPKYDEKRFADYESRCLRKRDEVLRKAKTCNVNTTLTATLLTSFLGPKGNYPT